jgi:pimeloyl-ACP methyl ester carboxylesterase
MADDHTWILVHGIRTRAEWQNNFAAWVAETPDQKLDVRPIGYGKFDLVSFWLPGPTRDKAYRKLRGKILPVIAANARLNRKTSIVAHSFGTYLMARLLVEETQVEIENLVLCGAIVSEDFRWEAVRRQIKGKIVNDCGTHDIWPVMASATTWGYGSTGTFGFKNAVVSDRVHFPLGHSSFFTQNFIENWWKPFVLNGEVKPGSTIESNNTYPWWIRALDTQLLKIGFFAMLGIASWMVWQWWMIPPNKPPEFHQKIASIELNMLEDLPLQTENLKEPLAVDPEEGLINYRVRQKPKYGTLELAKDETPLTYRPNEGYSGLDDFQIEAIDPEGGRSTQSYRLKIIDQCTGDEPEMFAGGRRPLFSSTNQCAVHNPNMLVSEKLNRPRPSYSCENAKRDFGNEDLTEKQLLERAKVRANAGDQKGALDAINLCICETPDRELDAYDQLRVFCWLRSKWPRLSFKDYNEKYPYKFLQRLELPPLLQNPQN